MRMSTGSTILAATMMLGMTVLTTVSGQGHQPEEAVTQMTVFKGLDAAEKTPAGFDSVVRLLKAAPDEEAQDRLWKPIFAGLLQTDRDRLPPHELAQIIAARWKSKPGDITLSQLVML